MDENEESVEINENDEINNFNSIINNSKLLINKEIHKFLFFLLSNIFLKNIRNSQFDNKLKDWIKQINLKIIKRADKYIKEDYSINNFKNIINFTKYQNKKYAGDILEGILIMIFSKGFKIDRDKSFTKYLYYNCKKLDNISNFELVDWFQSKIFNPQELKDLKLLFIVDSNYDNDTYIEYRNNSVLYNFLVDISTSKYSQSNYPKYNNNYNNSFFNNSSNNLYNKKNSISLNKAFILNQYSMSNILFTNNNYFLDIYDKTNLGLIKIIRPFFISVYIYYQNKHSPLMNYIKSDKKSNKKKLAIIPFEFNLSYAKISEKFSPVIFAPLRIEPRITKIILSRNKLGKLGLYELSKTLLFNKNIKIIDYSIVLMNSLEFSFINYGLGIFENFSVEELNFSHNYINSYFEENISKILLHFKNLKTLKLINKDIQNGISSFFITLKKLYRQRKTRLENLYLNKNKLDEKSFYELGELLKCKYCKLKKISLNNNNLPYNINILKKCKNNKSLIEVYLSNNDEISDNDVNDISKILSNSYINYLNLSKNKIYNFDNFLRIIYRTKIIKEKNEKNNIVMKESFLINLDMSFNNTFKNPKQIILLSKIIQNTTLECLDVSRILFGSNPSLMSDKKEKIKYKEKVEELKEILIKDKNKYLEINEEILENEADIKEFDNNEDSIFFENLNDYISLIINDENADSPVFLRENAKKIINDEKNTFIREKICSKNKINEIKANEIEQKLVNYMIVKKAKENIINLEKEKKNKKLILI